MPGLAERWGTDVLHCPYCHGWEVRDRAIAVLATTPMAAHQALLFRQLSDDVVVVVHDGVEIPDEEMEKLGAIGVRFAHGTPQEVVTDGDALVGLRLADGSVLERDAIVVASKPHVRADFLGPLGIEPTPFEMNGVAFGSVIDVEPTGATAVPGIFAAGNATDISMILIASAAHGAARRRLDQRRARRRRRRASGAGPARRVLRAARLGGALLRRQGVERPGQRPARGRGRRARARPRARHRLRRGRRRDLAGRSRAGR